MPALMFVAYLLYGFLRPFISRAWRREIEDEDEPGDPSASGEGIGRENP
jgi:CDP-diacylglycerol--serine O-phosphatidyltransferase